MGWLSILPDNLSAIELWAARFFIFLGLLTIGPWAAILLYDLVLYLFRTIAYEIPLVGGRARGYQRPRGISLTERPSGRPRNFSLAAPSQSSTDYKAHKELKQRAEKVTSDGNAAHRSERRHSDDG